MSSELSEICWIINQRNQWARRRGVVRHRLYRARMSSRNRHKVPALQEEFDRINSERLRLRAHTGRLRALVKKTDARLISNSSAGYDAILFRGSLRIINRDEIPAIADEYEMQLAISVMLAPKPEIRS